MTANRPPIESPLRGAPQVLRDAPLRGAPQDEVLPKFHPGGSAAWPVRNLQ